MDLEMDPESNVLISNNEKILFLNRKRIKKGFHYKYFLKIRIIGIVIKEIFTKAVHYAIMTDGNVSKRSDVMDSSYR